MFLQVIVLFLFECFEHFLGCGAPRAKPVPARRSAFRHAGVASDSRSIGATSRPKVGAFIHGQRPWLSAAGINCGFAESVTKGSHGGSASGQDGGFPIMLSKDGAGLFQRVRLDKLELRQFHFNPPALVFPKTLLGAFPLYRDDQLTYSYRGISLLCQDNGSWKYSTNYGEMVPIYHNFKLIIYIMI